MESALLFNFLVKEIDIPAFAIARDVALLYHLQNTGFCCVLLTDYTEGLL
jgi:hypothetical protein